MRGNDLWLEMKESGVIDKTVLVFGQMNEPPGSQIESCFNRFDDGRVFQRHGRAGRALVY